MLFYSIHPMSLSPSFNFLQYDDLSWWGWIAENCFLKGWSGSERLRSIVLNRFTICLTAGRNATGFPCDKQRFDTYGARKGPGRTRFWNYLGCHTPTPLICTPECITKHVKNNWVHHQWAQSSVLCRHSISFAFWISTRVKHAICLVSSNWAMEKEHW